MCFEQFVVQSNLNLEYVLKQPSYSEVFKMHKASCSCKNTEKGQLFLCFFPSSSIKIMDLIVLFLLNEFTYWKISELEVCIRGFNLLCKTNIQVAWSLLCFFITELEVLEPLPVRLSLCHGLQDPLSHHSAVTSLQHGLRKCPSCTSLQ